MKQQKSLKKMSGGLMGALAIAGGSSAYASVIVVTPPPNVNVPPGTATFSEDWDVNSDGIMDFTINYRFPNTSTGSGVIWQANLNPFAGTAATNGVVGYSGPFIRYAFAFSGGTAINAGSPFSTSTQVCLGSRYLSGGVPNFYGGFAAGPTVGNGGNGVTPGTFAFAGFRFQAADGIHFGWINLAVDAGTINFTNAAFESSAGTPINTGAIPEPSTLAMLALGAAGVLGTAIKRRLA
jgi:PEP-CTERM putative exosortase interaction domain